MNPFEPICATHAPILFLYATLLSRHVDRVSAREHRERWRRRLPLLEEDPREDELPKRPPGEEHGRPASLSTLGERLVGCRDWPTDSVHD